MIFGSSKILSGDFCSELLHVHYPEESFSPYLTCGLFRFREQTDNRYCPLDNSVLIKWAKCASVKKKIIINTMAIMRNAATGNLFILNGGTE